MSSKVEQVLVTALHKIKPDGQPIPHNRWQRVLSKILRTLAPAPYRKPLMEWEYGPWEGSFAAYDEAGRQLGEANVLPEWLATPLADKWSLFKGPGIRQGHLYNVDALREVTQYWDDLLTDGAALRTLYCRLHQQDPDKTLSAKDLLVIATVAVSIPAFLLRRGDHPTRNGTLPGRAAAAFKVIGGMFAATSRMLIQAHPMLTQSKLEFDEFLAYLESEQLLMSPESRACAAPVKMIRQIFDAIVEPGFAGGSNAESGLPHLGAAAERVFNYGSLCARIDLGVQLHWRSLRHCLLVLLNDPDTSTSVLDMLLQDQELGIKNDTPLTAYHKVARHLLSLFENPTVEYQLIAALPFTEQKDQNSNIALAGSHCYHIETAMRTFARQHQQTLDQLLQRKALKLSPGTWSPAPGSGFLKRLMKADSRLAVNR